MTNAAPIIDHATEPAQPRAVGELRLSAVLRDGQTRIKGLRQAGSLKALFPQSRGPALDAVFLNIAGGLTGGDRMRLSAEARPGARIVLSSQAAERAYRARGASVARVQVNLTVQAGARIDWLPQETILFDGAALDRRLSVDLAADASVLIVEPVILGRAAMGETLREVRFRDRREIRMEGQPLWIDPLALDATALNGTATLQGARAFATIVMTGEATLDPLRAVLDEPGVTAAVSAFAGRTVVRMLAPDGWPLRRQIIRALHILRQGRPLPRVWQV